MEKKGDNTLAEVRDRFRADRFATENGAFIVEVREGYAKCRLDIKEQHLNAAGTVMGGVLFTLADFAFAVAANWNGPLTVTLNSQITFTGVARGTYVTAAAHCVKDGRTTCYYTVDVEDEHSRLVASVTVNGFKKD